jgi:hypothetical protein
MTSFEVIHEDQALPLGFATYSLLLIPDGAWPERVGAERMFELARRFKSFGEALGARHLASWPYHGLQQSHLKQMDYEVCALIYGFVKTQEELENFVANRSDQLRAKKYLSGEYDMVRARHLCALYDLSFDKGPYIAFFRERPYVPTTWSRSFYGRYPQNSSTPSKPSFVIQFGGADFPTAVSLLNALELELISGRERIARLRFSQLCLSLADVCRRISSSAKASLEMLKTVKEIVD